MVAAGHMVYWEVLAVQPMSFSPGLWREPVDTLGRVIFLFGCSQSYELNSSLKFALFPKLSSRVPVFLKIMIQTSTGGRQTRAAVIVYLLRGDLEKQVRSSERSCQGYLWPPASCVWGNSSAVECTWAPRQPGVVWTGSPRLGQVKFTRLRMKRLVSSCAITHGKALSSRYRVPWGKKIICSSLYAQSLWWIWHPSQRMNQWMKNWARASFGTRFIYRFSKCSWIIEADRTFTVEMKLDSEKNKNLKKLSFWQLKIELFPRSDALL